MDAGGQSASSMQPFGSSPLWPPLDEAGAPRPLLAAILVVLTAVVIRLFYSKSAKDIGEDMARKQLDSRVAQMTAIIANQKSRFKLSREQAEELREVDLGAPKIYEAKDDLVVKAEIRVTVDLEEAVEEQGERMSDAKPPGEASSPGADPPKLELTRQTSAQLSGRSIEAALKGRKLTAVIQGDTEQLVSTVEDVENVFSKLRDADYPVAFVLKSTPPEASRLFALVVDEIFDEPVTNQGIAKTSAQFLAVKDLLKDRLREELDAASTKTLYARGLEGAGHLPLDELRDVASFHSGEKLRAAIKLAKKVKKHFPELIAEGTLKAAQDTNRRVGSSQRGKMSTLLGLLAPSLPYWCIAVLLHGCLEVVVARLCTGQSAIMDLVTTKKITVAEATVLVMQWLSGWWVLRIWGWFTAGLFQARAARMFGIRIRGEAMRAILQQDFEYFDKNPAGELQERLNSDAERLNRNLLHIPKELCTELIAILANAYIVYTMAPTDMFLTAMIPLPIIAFGQWCMLKSAERLGRITHRLGEEAAANTAQILSEIKTVREFVMECEETRRYTAGGMLKASIDETCQSRAGFCGHGMGALHHTGEGITLLLGISKVANGEMSAGDLIAVMMMISCMIGGKLRGIFEKLADLALVIEPAGRICDLVNSRPKIECCTEELRVMVDTQGKLATLLSAISKDGHTARTLSEVAECGVEVPSDRKLMGVVTASGSATRAPGKADLEELLKHPSAFPLQLRFTKRLAPTRLNGRFDFEDVDFRYPSDPRKLVLAGVSFTVEQGQQAALTGHAGCGKTTIFKLIQRLYDPNAGRVLLDGRPLADYDVHYLRSKIAIVAQENVLFATSILENIRYGLHPPPPESDVKEALRQASALHFVEAFPDQLLTRVGSRGLALSGGQRQRVAIARAMVRKPNILILDEATSALDPVNEKIVQAALDHLVKTTGASTLTIAHRLTTVMKCDKILVFAEGRLKEQGTHEELLKIPVERLPPRGENKEGQVISGLYRVQWHNMMGTKPEEAQVAKQVPAEPISPTNGELAKLRAETMILRSKLQLAQKRLRASAARGKVSTVHEDSPSTPDMLSQLQKGGHGFFDLYAAEHMISGVHLDRTMRMSDPPGVKGVAPPPMLSYGDRHITAPW